jgi:hypothetical protein
MEIDHGKPTECSIRAVPYTDNLISTVQAFFSYADGTNEGINDYTRDTILKLVIEKECLVTVGFKAADMLQDPINVVTIEINGKHYLRLEHLTDNHKDLRDDFGELPPRYLIG